MGWEIGFDRRHNRDIGHGVPAVCDHPDCGRQIDRGLAHLCGFISREVEGCGLFFCDEHLVGMGCPACNAGEAAYDAKPDIGAWVQHKLTDPSWAEWRAANPDWVALYGRT